MKAQIALVLILATNFASAQYANAAKTVMFSMVGGNSLNDSLPANALIGKTYRAAPGAQYVKIHLFPDTPFLGLSKIEIDHCTAVSRKKWAFAYINFDERTTRSDFADYHEGFATAEEALSEKPAPAPSKTETLKSDWSYEVNSVTLNFGRNSGICITDLRIFDKDGKRVPVAVPRYVNAKVSADSVLKPAESYSPYNLFDSRFESAWASDKKMKGVSLSFDFESEVTIAALKVWNGYQRSTTHCQQNSRAKKVTIEAGGQKETATLTDALGSQLVTLKKPLKGKSFRLVIDDAFAGSSYKDLVISELRFSDGKDWFAIDPLSHVKAVTKKNRELFAKAKADELLDRSMHSADGWEFRFRSDGTMYIEGKMPNPQDEGLRDSYYALGNYEILSADAKEMKLRIFGYMRKFEGESGGDCNGCGHNCNAPGKNQKGLTEAIFQDQLRIWRGALLNIENVSKKPRMNFKNQSIGSQAAYE